MRPLRTSRVPTLAILTLVTARAAAQAPEFHVQYGGLVAWTWVAPDPDPAHPGATLIWTAGTGQNIDRYESWSGARIEDHYFGLSAQPRTLHHVFFTEDLSYGYAVGDGGEAYHLPQGYHTSDFGRHQYWRPDATNLIANDSFGGTELWESYWKRDDAGRLQGWVAGEDNLLMFTPDQRTVPFAQVGLPSGTDIDFKCLGFKDPDDTPGAIIGAAGGDSGIVYTQDGVVWRTATIEMADPGDPLPDPFWIWDIDFAPGASLAGFAVAGEREGNGPGWSFRTIDGGVTWQEVLRCKATPGASCPDEVAGTQTPPACTGGPGHDGLISPDLPYSTLYAVSAASDGSALAAGYAGGIFRYDPDQDVFVSHSDGVHFAEGPLWGMHSFEDGVNPLQAWVSGHFGALRRSLDGGLGWNDVGDRTTWRMQGVAFATRNRGWICGQDLRIARTQDGGETWREQHAVVRGPLAGEYLQAIAACDRGQSAGFSAVAVGGVTEIDANGEGNPATIMFTVSDGFSCSWRTLDWSPASVEDLGFLFPQPGETRKIRLNDVCFSGVDGLGQKHYWVAGDRFKPDNAPLQAAVLHTARGGRHWRQVSGIPGWFNARGVVAVGLDTVYLVGHRQLFSPAHAFVTYDARSANPTWIDISPESDDLRPIARLNAVAARGNRAFAVGRDGVVLRFDGTRFVPFTPLYDYDAATGTVQHRFTDARLHEVVWPRGDDKVFIGGDDGMLLRVDDVSGSFEQLNPRSVNDIQSMSFVAPTLGWAAGDQGRWGDSTVLTYR